MIHQNCWVSQDEAQRFKQQQLLVGYTLVVAVVRVDGGQRVRILVDLQDEGFGQSVARDLLWDLLLLGLCVLSVVLGFPQSLVEGLVV